MMAKFCANLSFLFVDRPFVERYRCARAAGFEAVESGFPWGVPLGAVKAAREAADVDQILLNIRTGDVGKGELGDAAIPGRETAFADSLHATVEYARALRAGKIHLMSGRIEGGAVAGAAHDACLERNLRYAVALLERERIVGLLEPINKHSVPAYYMDSYEKALSMVQRIGSPNLKILLDIFHVQQIKGDVTRTIRDLMPHVGHVQIAQVPCRGAPNTDGELNYKYVLRELERAGYDDWIGLEYLPRGGDGGGGGGDDFAWIREFGYSL